MLLCNGGRERKYWVEALSNKQSVKEQAEGKREGTEVRVTCLLCKALNTHSPVPTYITDLTFQLQ